MAPLISIITVTFNAGATLPATIKSVEEQSFKDFEYIIVDGKSRDNTLELARACRIKNLEIKSEPDKGIYDAMNKGIGMAKGRYLIFLNAGDSFHSPDTLQRIADAISDNDTPGIVYGQTELVDSNRNSLGPRHLTAPEELTYESFKHGMLVCHQAFVVLAKIAPLFDLKYKLSADYDWCIQCLQHSRKNVYLPGVMIDYLSEGASTQQRRRSLRERFKIMCYYYGTFPTIMRHISFVPRFLANRRRMKSAQAAITKD